MKALLDTNVVLDVWLAREPYWRDSANVLAKAEREEIEGWLCPTTLTTLHYLGRKVLGEARTRELVGQLIGFCGVCEMSRKTFDRALGSRIADFEDAVVEAVSVETGIDCIVTRNISDFKKSTIPAREPAEILGPQSR